MILWVCIIKHGISNHKQVIPSCSMCIVQLVTYYTMSHFSYLVKSCFFFVVSYMFVSCAIPRGK